jgi:GNAT superfamily N-acetyltransferase
MKAKKVFSLGKILDADLYEKVKIMDKNIFFGCNDEFHTNREWWVYLNSRNTIVAYCGSIYANNICIFIRAWVKKTYRGKGVQKKLIDTRIRAARKLNCFTAITYTTSDNCPSINNLIAKGFKIYLPEYSYGGKEMLYWKKNLDSL